MAASERSVVSSAEYSKESASRIRLDLMYKLGVDVAGARSGVGVAKLHPTSERSMLGRVARSHLPLNDTLDGSDGTGNALSQSIMGAILRRFGERTKEDEPLHSSHSTDSSVVSAVSSVPTPSPAASRCLAFDDRVTVCLIPTRDEYSKRIRSQLWIPQDEMMRNVERNAVEFAAEGWDWKASLEDDQMYRCVQSNELIHPIHVEHRT